MKAADRILPDVIQQMRRHIANVDGNEVLFVAHLDSQGMVCGVTAAAHGHRSMVPAPAGHTERGDIVIHNHPAGRLVPSEADIQVAASLAAGGVGSFIVDNPVDELYVIVEPVRRRAATGLDVTRLAETLAPGGGLSRLHSGFEPRESQTEMLTAVARAFNHGRIAVLEAGTGTGKSFAYLIPAIQWATQNEERVVISTATINLQQQLMEKDIPLVQRLLGSRERAVLVKGRGNYLCPLRLGEAIEEAGLFNERLEELHSLRQWSASSPTGSRSELPFMVTDGLWGKVNSDADVCTGMRCREQQNCFVLRARREAAAARILVANHHLLFSDLALRVRGVGFEQAAVLPPFQRLVFDEAHTIENSATSFFSRSFSRFSVAKLGTRLYRSTRQRSHGLAVLLQRLSPAGQSWDALPQRVDDVLSGAEALNRLTVSLVQTGGGSVRLTQAPVSSFTEPLFAELGELQSRVTALVDYVAVRIRGLNEEDQDRPEVYETRQILRRLEEIAALCEQLRHYADEPQTVYWIERRGVAGEPFVRFVASPVEIGPVMVEAVYDPFETVVFTSATLTVDSRFDFWTNRVGLNGGDPERVVLASFPSPYRFDRQVLLALPQDAPAPQDAAYTGYVSRFVRDLLTLSEGGGLVLFTSYGMLDTVYDEVKPQLEEQGISVLRQGDDDRARLLGTFTADPASVLFATDSFWEGIDAPGHTLRVVVLCRLPFRVPSDPVLQARMELIQSRGGSPFAELSLPEAVIRLKQGFGRLMRRADDRGVVVITDSRIVTRSYGPVFLNSLPQTACSVKARDRLMADIESFLFP
ncbi:MAG: DEAD/DEAH box helicase [Spirochaetaceae bacterium]|nr:MAG: DEAD/DEAH box helicase [Spirochaetaceae bacterium]